MPIGNLSVEAIKIAEKLKWQTMKSRPR